MAALKPMNRGAAEVRRWRGWCAAASASLPRRLPLLCLLALALLAPVAQAAAPTPAKQAAKLTPIPPVGPSPITPDCRYLFVVDMSSAMQRSADGLYRATHRLLASGLGGRMQEGDVFTVWTYADTVLTREFPLNAWTPDLNIAIANRAYEFLAQQKFRGTSNLRPVFAELGQALAISTNLTIILISDGTDVIVGTPFDRPINITYGKRTGEMRTAKMPFITSLVTQRGEFTQWSVRGGLEDIGLPVPVLPVVSAPALAQTPAAVTPPPPAPTPAPVPLFITPKPAAPTNPPPVVFAAKPPEPVVPKPAPPSPPPVPSPVPKAVTNTFVVAPPPPQGTPPPAPPPPPKQEAKATQPPPPALVAVTPKPPVPAPQPELMPPTIALVLQPLPPGIPPALRQPKSFIDASNALAKIELLRPPTGTAAPPAKPLEARIIEPRPAPPTTTNTVAAVPKPAPATATNSPVAKPTTNATAATTAPPTTVPIIVPPTKQPVAKPTEPKASATTTNTNSPARTNAAAPTVAGKPKSEVKNQEHAAPAANAPAKPVKPTGQLAVAAPGRRDGGWVYLAAAMALLITAGAIIAYLLRSRPQPSAISQSLDDHPG